MPRTVSADMRRATNVTLPEGLSKDARLLGINVLQACEQGVLAEIVDVRRRCWLDDNKDAVSAWNDYVAEQGLPLDRFRQF